MPTENAAVIIEAKPNRVKVCRASTILPPMKTADGKVIEVGGTYWMTPNYQTTDKHAVRLLCTSVSLKTRGWIGQRDGKGAADESMTENVYSVRMTSDRIFSSRSAIIKTMLADAKKKHTYAERGLLSNKRAVRVAARNVRKLEKRLAALKGR